MSNRLACILLTLFLCAAPTWSVQMPRGSFLKQPARSAWQLATQVRTDPLVADRYERHYRVSALRFADYAQSQLGVRPLTSGGRYRVFFIRADGSVGSALRKLRRGTPVFIHLRTGKPVLLAECGNPMSTSLPGYPITTGQNAAPPQRTADKNTTVQEQPEVVPVPPPVASLPSDPLELAEAAQMQAVDTPLWDAPLALIMPDIPLPGVGATADAAPVSWTPMLMVGASGLFSLGGHSPKRGGTTPPPAVPEPASLSLWAIAGAALAGAKWVQKRQKVTDKRRSTVFRRS